MIGNWFNRMIHPQILVELFSTLDRIQKSLKEVLYLLHTLDLKVNKIMSQEDDLKAGLTQLGTVLDNTETELERFIVDYKAKTGTDLTDELATVTSLLGKAQAHHDEIVAADPAPQS